MPTEPGSACCLTLDLIKETKAERQQIDRNASSVTTLSEPEETSHQGPRTLCLGGNPLFKHCTCSSIPAVFYVTLLDTYSSIKDRKEAEEPMFVQP